MSGSLPRSLSSAHQHVVLICSPFFDVQMRSPACVLEGVLWESVRAISRIIAFAQVSQLLKRTLEVTYIKLVLWCVDE
eukprot:5662578-Amphidinium_carterae.1